ncbi:MAG: hypothetical protein IPN13_12955 [Bacteroidetes bacterium]|nr:hypothetical protein [Bacteroidota bacterium]
MKPNNNYLLPYRNYIAFIIGAISFVVFIYTQYTLISNFPKLNMTDSRELVIICQILMLSCAIWASQIAKLNNHGALLWFFISLFIGPLGLIIMSIRDRKIKDPRINSLVLNFRNEFKSKLKLAPESKESIVNELQSKLNTEISKIPYSFPRLKNQK